MNRHPALKLVGAAIAAGAMLLPGCSKSSSPTAPTTTTPTTPGGSSQARPIYVVLFTHIEDNTPGGIIGSAGARTQYLNLRSRLIEMAELTRRYGVKWSLEPDWKFLLAALEYEDASVMSTTGGVNLLRHLRDSLGAAIDPHSHEGGGYNYTDVAHLLSQLGVGGSTVIGGHIWDPSYPQFQEWDRFRVPVAGLKYPTALWRGDILMGSGTPNHVADPIISGIWRPRSRSSYFEDDPSGNISCVGAYKGDLAGISELSALYGAGTVGSTCMLTSSYHVNPAALTAAGGLSTIETSVVSPLATLKSRGQAELTDFTSLVATWRSTFGAQTCTYRGSAASLKR